MKGIFPQHSQVGVKIYYKHCFSNEQSEKEIKKIPYVIASKRIKYLGINLTKWVKDFHIKN